MSSALETPAAGYKVVGGLANVYRRANGLVRRPCTPLRCGLVHTQRSTHFGQRNPQSQKHKSRDWPVQSMPGKAERVLRPKAGGSAWLPSGAVLALGGALPGVMLAWRWKQVSSIDESLAIALVDLLFIVSATVFLSTGSLFGKQRYHTVPKYPGPFKELDGSLVPPAYFKAYVASTPLLLSVIAPAAAFAYLLWQHELHQGVSTLGVYLIELVAQLISESVYVKQGSVMWPQVPQVYQTYRIWQLIRGCYLVGACGGPDWLWVMQAVLIFLWVFNFGAVMIWTPWLYRWHLQPDSIPGNNQKSN